MPRPRVIAHDSPIEGVGAGDYNDQRATLELVRRCRSMDRWTRAIRLRCAKLDGRRTSSDVLKVGRRADECARKCSRAAQAHRMYIVRRRRRTKRSAAEQREGDEHRPELALLEQQLASHEPRDELLVTLVPNDVLKHSMGAKHRPRSRAPGAGP